jgi:hypothetical protein
MSVAQHYFSGEEALALGNVLTSWDTAIVSIAVASGQLMTID